MLFFSLESPSRGFIRRAGKQKQSITAVLSGTPLHQVCLPSFESCDACASLIAISYTCLQYLNIWAQKSLELSPVIHNFQRYFNLFYYLSMPLIKRSFCAVIVILFFELNLFKTSMVQFCCTIFHQWHHLCIFLDYIRRTKSVYSFLLLNALILFQLTL